MFKYYIAYDLQAPGQDYERLISAIRVLGLHSRLQYSLWQLTSSLSQDAVFNFLSRFIDRNDRLEVMLCSSSRGTNRLSDIGKNAVIAALLKR